MDKEQAKKRIDKLVAEINIHRYNYHVLDKETLAPELLDDLKLELFRLENDFPQFIKPDSPTQKVAGEVSSKFKKVNHSSPMISLFDAFTEADILSWQNKNENYLKRTINPQYYCELKLDGLAINITYRQKVFTQAATRGNGKVGEDVSSNIRVIPSVPLSLRVPDLAELKNIGLERNEAEKLLQIIIGGRVEIRGEAIMNKNVLAQLNSRYRKEGKPLLANTRNGAAGSIRQLDPKISAERKLDFYAYDLILFDLSGNILERGKLIKTRLMADQLSALLGFKKLKDNSLVTSLEEVFSYYKKVEKKRESLPFEIDGVVVKFNDLKMWPVLGIVGKAPRYMMAYKFSAEQAVTRVNDIIWQAGRTGSLTPVAVLDPVQVGGALISRSTLHNFDEINRLDLRLGDSVVIERSGDVIPKVINVLKNLRTGAEKKIIAPKVCPICAGKVERLEDEVAYRCLNKNCYAVNLRKISHYISKAGADMEGLGPKVIEQFLALGLIRDVADLYFLKKEDLENLERFAQKKITNTLEIIKKRKELNLAHFIYALGIRHVGEETASLLAQEISKDLKIRNREKLSDDHFLSVSNLLSFFTHKPEEYFHSLPDVGPIVAKSIYEFWHDEHSLNLMKKFESAGLKLSLKNILVSTQAKNLNFFGKTFVLTGSLSGLTRQEAKDKIKAAGAKVSSDVSVKTDFVLAGAEAGSKLEKAKKLKVKIINQKDFLEMLN